MARIQNIRGMFLEEALLHLLETSGYKTVDNPAGDPTLQDGSAGIKVKGRGGFHQIDAIADFRVHQPFSNPQRLLVEAKCFEPRQPVGLPFVRGAVGTLKDVSEFWMTAGGQLPKQSYHYQYAMFSATGYTKDAQRYAFAHDIYLIPLAASRFLNPVIQGIRNVTPAQPSEGRSPDLPIEMKELRREVRRAIRGLEVAPLVDERFGESLAGLRQFVQTCRQIRYALLAVLGARFPVFLVPSPDTRDERLRDEYDIRIFRGPQDRTWFLRERDSGRDLFSFDLPQELFLRYADAEILSAGAALDLKAEMMASFHAIVVEDGHVHLIAFRLDLPWINQLRDQIGPRTLR